MTRQFATFTEQKIDKSFDHNDCNSTKSVPPSAKKLLQEGNVVKYLSKHSSAEDDQNTPSIKTLIILFSQKSHTVFISVIFQAKETMLIIIT